MEGGAQRGQFSHFMRSCLKVKNKKELKDGTQKGPGFTLQCFETKEHCVTQSGLAVTGVTPGCIRQFALTTQSTRDDRLVKGKGPCRLTVSSFSLWLTGAISPGRRCHVGNRSLHSGRSRETPQPSHTRPGEIQTRAQHLRLWGKPLPIIPGSPYGAGRWQSPQLQGLLPGLCHSLERLQWSVY